MKAHCCCSKEVLVIEPSLQGDQLTVCPWFLFPPSISILDDTVNTIGHVKHVETIVLYLIRLLISNRQHACTRMIKYLNTPLLQSAPTFHYSWRNPVFHTILSTVKNLLAQNLQETLLNLAPEIHSDFQERKLKLFVITAFEPFWISLAGEE